MLVASQATRTFFFFSRAQPSQEANEGLSIACVTKQDGPKFTDQEKKLKHR